jgi:hypothetical protein
MAKAHAYTLRQRRVIHQLRADAASARRASEATAGTRPTFTPPAQLDLEENQTP